MRDGWTTVKIGDVCSVVAGQSPKGSNYNEMGEGLPFYQGKKHFGAIFLCEPTIWTTQITKEAFPGDILMSVRAPVGPINLTNKKVCIGRGLGAIRAGKNVDRMYLFYFLLFKQKDIRGNEGAVFASINKNQIKDIELPLPPLPEQKRIVAILDEAFAGIEKAMANTEKNLANARELFDSYLFFIFTACANNWKTRELGQVCNIVGGGTPSKNNSAFYDGDIPWATVRDMRKPILSRTEFCITQEAVQSSSTNIIPADNVIIATRVGLGKVCLINQDTAINQDLRGIIPKSKELDVNYLFRWLQSVSRKIEDEGTGATVKGVKLPFIKSLSIPLPPLSEQVIIVEQLNDLDHGTQRLQSIYQQKLTALAELKQSLLQKAFSGELTADEQLLPAEVAA
jgi:type I restriction enzyme, S subunit